MGNNTLVIPRMQSRRQLIKKIHSEFGHIGISGTKSIITDYYYWPTLDLDITMAVNECCFCQKYKHNTRRRNPLKGSLRTNYPFEKVAMDIAGPMRPTRRGNRYILGMIDHFSKYPVLIPIKSTDSNTIVEAIFTKWISVYGIPDSLHSDRGANLNSEKVMDFCSGLGIKKTTTTSYYPQGDGVIERLFRTTKPLLGIVSDERQIDWDEAIPYVEMGLRNKRNASGFSPNVMLFGQNVKILDTGALQSTKQKYNSAGGYVSKLIRRISDIHKKVNTKEIVTGRTNTWRNGFNQGDLVWVRKIGSKSGNILFDGPYQIKQVIGKNAFRLQDKNGKIIDRNIIYLKPYRSRGEMSRTVPGSLTSVESFKETSRNDILSNPTTDREEATISENTTGRRYPTRIRTLPKRYGFSK